MNNPSIREAVSRPSSRGRSAFFLMDQETPSTSLAPNEAFREDQQKTLSAVAILDIACAAISSQPLFDKMKGVPDLQAHQERSKKMAESWRGNVRPVLFKVNDTIINFSIEFNAFYDPLVAYAEQLADPEKCLEAQSNLIEGLNALMDVLKDQKMSVEKARDRIAALQKEIFENESELAGDLNKIEATYQGEKGELADLKKLVASCESAMSRDLTIIGAGAVGGVVGILVVAVGVAMWVETIGGSTPVIVIGVAMIGGGGAAAGYGIYDYNKSSKQKAEALREISKLDAEIALATTLKTSVSSLISHLDTASRALDKLAGAWGQLERDYENLITALQKTEGNAAKTKPLSFIVKANLSASKDLWNTLKEDAQKVKDNLLAPLKTDTTALDQSDKKNPSFPDVPTEGPRNLQARSLRAIEKPALSLEQITTISAQAYKPWLESTTQALLGFGNELNTLSSQTTLPPDVQANAKELNATSEPALTAADQFLAANELLSGKALDLRQTTKLSDAEIVGAAHRVLDELTLLIHRATDLGQKASTKVLVLDQAIDKVDASLLKWLQRMQDEKTSDESKLKDAIRLRQDAENRKNDLKKHFWACFLGPAACAIVALEAGIRIKNAQSDIDAYNKTIVSLDKSLKALLSTVNITTSLTVNAAALGKSVDGGLKAIQVILTTVEGLRGSESNVPFILRAHLQALAEQIEGISTLRLAKSSRMLQAQLTDGSPDSTQDLLDYLQSLFASALLVHSSSLIISKQPALNSAENLLKENQALVRNHSIDWNTNTHHHVLSQLSALGAIGGEISHLGEEVKKLLDLQDSSAAVEGIEAIKNVFNSYWGVHVVDGTLYKDTLALKLLNENLRNDQSIFQVVEGILRNDYAGDQGMLALLNQREKEYTQAINESLEDLVYNSTRVIGEHLAWAIVLGISLGLGQIEIAAAEAPTVMYLIRKGTNISVKAASSAGSAFAQSQIKEIERKGDNVREFIDKRAENLQELSLLKSDMSVLKVLVNDIEIMAQKSKSVLEALDRIKACISRDMNELSIIKFYVRSGKKEDSEQHLNTFLEKWNKVSLLTKSLEQSYLESQRFTPENA
jgi:hypothetical protein